MKKNTMKSLVAYLTEKNDPAMETVLAELNAELARGEEKADANRKVYAEMFDKVMEVLEGTTQPVTAAELATETGISKGKIVYGLTNLWGDYVEKDSSGKTTTYVKKA